MKKFFDLKTFLCLLVATLALYGGYLVLGGGGTNGLARPALAHLVPSHTTNIFATTTDHWAWNDLTGWINFHETDNVIVYSKVLAGFGSSTAIGAISLNCNATSNPDGVNYCGSSDYKVYNSGSGRLSGWAWNEVVGWFSFCGIDNLASSTPSCPYVSNRYQVFIDNSANPDQPPSDFTQYAWNDLIGWVSFNCVDPGFCPTSNYKVRTSWYPTSTYGDLYSTVFDTGVVGGAQFNSIAVRGIEPYSDPTDPTEIWVQFAASNCSSGAVNPPTCDSGTWTFSGPDGTTVTYYQPVVAGLDVGADNIYFSNLNGRIYNNQRYFRYRIRLKSNETQDLTPVVNDVIVNWSP